MEKANVGPLRYTTTYREPSWNKDIGISFGYIGQRPIFEAARRANGQTAIELFLCSFPLLEKEPWREATAPGDANNHFPLFVCLLLGNSVQCLHADGAIPGISN